MYQTALTPDTVTQILEQATTLEEMVVELGLLGPAGDVPGYDNLCVEVLPGWVSDLIDLQEAEIEYTFDLDYWGSDSFVSVGIFPANAFDESTADRLRWWKEDDDPEQYDRFCGALASLTWNAMLQSPNFPVVDRVLRMQ